MPTILAGALKRMPGLPANVVAGVPRVEKDPDENPEHDFIAQFWRPIMHDGIIQFERPDSTQLDQRIIRRNQHVKDFIEGRNFSMAEE